MNLPNILTSSRLLAIPVLMVLLGLRFPGHDQWAAGVFLLASLTDTADGNLARATGQVTELGKFLDPLADKLFILSVLIAMVQEGMLAAWVVVIIFGREMLITILRSLSATQGHVIAATPFGKTKTVTQVGAVALLILARPYPALHAPAVAAIALAVVFTIWSGADYIWRFRDVLLRPGAGGRGAVAPALPAVDPLAARAGEALRASGLRVAAAESCTGGLLAKLLTDQPGSSAWFEGGVVAYANAVKEGAAGVPAALLREHGAVSAEVATALAAGVRERLGTDLGVGITGIAGPGADGTGKPVGLTFVAVAGAGPVEVRRFNFSGDRWEVRRQAAEQALTMLLESLERRPESAR